jgi:transposase
VRSHRPTRHRQVLLADAYGGYNGVVAGNEITRAGCWAHLRRKVIEAERAAPEIAREAIELVRKLYVVTRICFRTADEPAGQGQSAKHATWHCKIWSSTSIQGFIPLIEREICMRRLDRLKGLHRRGTAILSSTPLGSAWTARARLPFFLRGSLQG